jgi:hypothetical protein
MSLPRTLLGSERLVDKVQQSKKCDTIRALANISDLPIMMNM